MSFITFIDEGKIVKRVFDWMFKILLALDPNIFCYVGASIFSVLVKY